MPSNRSALFRVPAIMSAALVAVAPLFACGGGDEQAPLIVTDVDWAPSEAGRVEVRFTVENPAENSVDLQCDVHALDADGFNVGRDSLSGETILGTRGAEAMDDLANVQTYRTVTGIDSDDVAEVQVEC